MNVGLANAVRRAKLAQKMPPPIQEMRAKADVSVTPTAGTREPLPLAAPIMVSATFGHWWGATAAPEPASPSIRAIQHTVCRHYNISMADLFGQYKAASIVRARHLAMYLARIMTTRSMPEIGRFFGGKDHTTVLHAVRKFEKLVSEDPQVAAEVEAVRSTIV